jgi:hypothetical protein
MYGSKTIVEYCLSQSLVFYKVLTLTAELKKKTIVLVYFQEKSQNYKSSTLWSLYSMLKTTVNLRDNVDISKFPKLISLLKRNVGYPPKNRLC